MPSAFETVIRLQLDRFSPEAARQKHIEIARAGLGAFLSRQSARPDVKIEVDGHAALSEDQVRPFGIIVYHFQRMREIVEFALDQARQLSPVLSGAYRNAWFVMADGSEVSVADVPNSGTVIVTNDQPYSRKINVGAKGFERYVPPGIVEKVRQQVIRKYGAVVDTNIEFITLDGGYVLKHGLRRIHQGRRYGGIRNDAQAGSALTYPSLSLTPKAF